MVSPSSDASRAPAVWPARIAGLLTGVLAAQFPVLAPAWKSTVLSGAAARLAAWLSGSPVEFTAQGWSLTDTAVPMLVTPACSAADFFALAAGILAWRFARRGKRWATAAGLGLFTAGPLVVVVNAARLLALGVMHAHLAPVLPENWRALLHLLTGVAVFLPVLVLLFPREFRHANQPVAPA